MSPQLFRAWHPELQQFAYIDLADTRRFGLWWEEPGAFERPQQFTGLHDKNGEKIWEGDFVSYKINTIKLENRLVNWDGANAQWAKGSQALSTYQKVTTIVGNIHQNPELKRDGNWD